MQRLDEPRLARVNQDYYDVIDIPIWFLFTFKLSLFLSQSWSPEEGRNELQFSERAEVENYFFVGQVDSQGTCRQISEPTIKEQRETTAGKREPKSNQLGVKWD